MNKSSTKVIVFSLCALIVGYVLGVVIPFAHLSQDVLRGDIEKASNNNQKFVNAEILTVEEKLQNDTNYLRGMVADLMLVNERINMFAQLVDITFDVCHDESALQGVSSKLAGMQTLASNAQQTSSEALTAVLKIANGEQVDFENALNQASLSYSMMIRESKYAKQIVDALGRAVSSKVQRSNEVAYVRDKWVHYCATESFLQGDEIAFDYWHQVKPLLSEKECLQVAQTNEALDVLPQPLTDAVIVYMRNNNRLANGTISAASNNATKTLSLGDAMPEDELLSVLGLKQMPGTDYWVRQLALLPESGVASSSSITFVKGEVQCLL